MKVTPLVTADFEEYPELRRLVDLSLRRVAELMEIHDIGELRRIRKNGVFDHPYNKDVVTPLGSPYVPQTVAAARYAVGKALLDYLEAIGIAGVSLGIAKEEADGVLALWAPPPPKKEQPRDPEPVGDVPEPGQEGSHGAEPLKEPDMARKTPEPGQPGQPEPSEPLQEPKQDKEDQDGRQTAD